MSPTLCTGTGFRRTLSFAAAVSIAGIYSVDDGFPGSKKTAPQVKPGTVSLSVSTHLPPISKLKDVKPVMFPIGSRQVGDKAEGDGITNLHEDGRYREGVLASVTADRAVMAKSASGADRLAPWQRARCLRPRRRHNGSRSGILHGPAQLPQPGHEQRSPGAKIGIVLRLDLEHAYPPCRCACCACTVKGHAAAAPLSANISCRRLMAIAILTPSTTRDHARRNVRNYITPQRAGL